MPPNVCSRYNWQPEAGSEEAKLYEGYLKPRDWPGQVFRFTGLYCPVVTHVQSLETLLPE